jgi:hypothetical protein
MRHVKHTGEINAINILVANPEGKVSFGRPRCRWENNIKTHLEEAQYGMWNGFKWLRTVSRDS